MMITKSDMLAAVDQEISDRENSVDEGLHLGEISGLNELKKTIELELPMDFSQYSWLVYLIAAWREAQLRDELE